MSTRIIGLGSAHGDDRIGLAAVESLAALGVPEGCTLHACSNPASELLPLLDNTDHAILVDAMVDDGPAGRVLRCTRDELAARPGQASSHGVSVDSLLTLAAALGQLPARVTLAGVTINAHGSPLADTLSPPVRAALPELADLLIRLARSEPQEVT